VGVRIIVGIGQIEVMNSPATLVGIALGSCVGLIVYDELNRVGGLAHIMLPSGIQEKVDGLPAKYADRAIPIMLERLAGLGGQAANYRAKLAGGAQMFLGGDGGRRHIGERNVELVRGLLAQRGIPLLARDTGGNYARTVEFSTETFKMSIRSISRDKRHM